MSGWVFSGPMTAPLARPDGTVWEPTPEATERLRAAMFGTVQRSVMARLAAARRREHLD